MKRTLVMIAIVALAAFALSGCGRVVGLVFEPNLSVDYFWTVEYNGEFAGLELAFENDGVWLSDVEFGIYVSDDEFVDQFDHMAYQSDFDIGFKGYEDKQIQRAVLDIGGLADGDYYVGVIVDPNDDIDESDESDNIKTILGPVSIAGGGGGSGLIPDVFEPNDNFNQWATFTMYQWHLANLHSDADEDWYEVFQEMDMPLTIETRPGPNGINVDVYVEVFHIWDPNFPVYSMGPAMNNYIYIPMQPAISEYYRVRVRTLLAGSSGEYEIQTY